MHLKNEVEGGRLPEGWPWVGVLLLSRYTGGELPKVFGLVLPCESQYSVDILQDPVQDRQTRQARHMPLISALGRQRRVDFWSTE